MRKLAILGIIVAAAVLASGSAYAWHANGKVFCDANGNGSIDAGDIPWGTAAVNVESLDHTFYDEDPDTHSDGSYHLSLEDFPQSYKLCVDATSLPGDATFVIPGAPCLNFTLTDTVVDHYFEWLFDSEECHPGEQDGQCWMTAGGVKFDRIADTHVAEHGPHDSVGGNVYPGCNADSGAEGGHWNHVAHREKLHFKGNPIATVVCGNHDAPPGSESPVTPYNFIEFWGEGTLNGIKGNRVDYGGVYFHAYVEDNNEPGNENSPAEGEDIDRYFLHVFADPANPHTTTLLLIDVDGDSTTIDPVTITGGNLQLHDNPCP
jgi:hypothetical protein